MVLRDGGVGHDDRCGAGPNGQRGKGIFELLASHLRVGKELPDGRFNQRFSIFSGDKQTSFDLA